MRIKVRTNGISDLQALMVFCLLSTLLFLSQPESSFTLFFGFFIFSIVPGYAILSSFFPGNKIGAESQFSTTFRDFDKSKLPIFDRLIPSFFISIAASSFVILFFEISGFSPGISFELQISVISTFFTSIALIRRSNLDIQDRFNLEIDFQTPSPRELSQPSQIIAVCLLLASSLAASLVLEVQRTPMVNESFTELFFLDESDSFKTYPHSVLSGQQNQISIGVSNQEGSSRTYDIEITHSFFGLDESSNRSSIGAPIFEENIETSVLQENFSIDHGSSRNFDYEFALDEEGLWGLEVELYTVEPLMDDSPHRRIFLWIEVS